MSALLQLRQRWKALAQEPQPATRLECALLASFTVDKLVPYLGVSLFEQGLRVALPVGPYNQIVQELSNPGSTTRQSRPGVLVVWMRFEDLALPGVGSAELWRRRDEALTAAAEAAVATARDDGATVIFVLPSVPTARPLGVGDASFAHGEVASAHRIREKVRGLLAEKPGVLLHDVEEEIRAVGTLRAYDARLEALARVPFTEELFACVGERLGRLVALSRRPAKKLLVLDADNTLWGGVLGEDGAENVQVADTGVGAAFKAFQAHLLRLREQGLLLALCSKNDEADVWVALARREMLLKKEHLAAWRIGWNPKSASIAAIADELSLGLDSVAFIDDSAAELEEVRANCPRVATIQMPADPTGWQSALERSFVLDRLPPTADDLRRAQFYTDERKRDEVRTQATSPAEYLRSLEIAVELFTPREGDLSRLEQLIQKTNQFNLNCVRLTRAELAKLAAGPDAVLRLLKAQDRFGDYGTVGAYVATVSGERAELRTFLLSCRALGRQVEQALLADATEQVKARGAKALVATVLEAPRNEPARRFFASLGLAPGVSSSLPEVAWPEAVRRVTGG